ncbi:hypothetical protein SeMB42_g04425 [Synchytrium endobioticum]|uniref:Tetrahydrofolate dehydrogenase/cyclohydrolase NAD(P)-binding domain-containing protein n=1 Tax=Synchytrium endobioticum TaxID=286115 RepID=A0A507CZ05_9FUNG|nr:hypothetical protein SeLEV6574_g06773 [Synchytrium endobioticum]TPX44140.1 hypothetical protein SeMB42_g04425 [Synchytrium endobioticum]
MTTKRQSHHLLWEVPDSSSGQQSKKIRRLRPAMTTDSVCQVVSPVDVAAPFLDEIKRKLSNAKEKPLLVAFLANGDPAAKKYAEWTAKTCRQADVEFELREVPRTQLEEAIMEANEDVKVNGMMSYFPVFGGTQDQYLQNLVDINKDVEGLSHQCRVNMYHNVRFLDSEKTQKCIIPCTPLAVIKILEYVGVYSKILPYGNRLYGKTITVINRSEVVGRPLAALLANDGAKVFSVDEHGLLEFHRGQGLKLRKHEVFETTFTLDQALGSSDVVITGVPSDKYKVDTSKLKDGVIAINFSSAKNFYDDITSKASIFVASIGKVTVAMLLRNLLRVAENQAVARGEERNLYGP